MSVRPQDITHVLYHARCDDGFGAAYAAWLVLGDEAAYLPVNHGDPAPELPEDAVVAVVDFSYNRPEILRIREKVKDLIILDHHLTALHELEGLEFAHFDMSKSGAHLTWNYFHPDKPLPELLAYIEDKDLWLFKLEKSREVTAALRSYPMDFALWHSLDVNHLKEEGISLLRFQEQLVAAACQRTRWASILEFEVPVVNATDFRSEIANRLCELFPHAPFAAAYFDNENGFRTWSLRSVGDFDVAAVARRLGGGGHKNASGFVETDPVPAPPRRGS